MRFIVHDFISLDMELTNSSIDKSEKDLELAIRSDDLTLLHQVLQRGANVNSQNSDGNTALHLAVANDADIVILRTLMENGATVAIENKYHRTPVQCLKYTSLQTVANLLKLEKCFDFRDSNNNSLMHIFMSEKMYFNQKDFWKMIVTEYEFLNINFNSQNTTGVTPLILAAQSHHPDDPDHKLKYILNNIDNLDLFVTDCNGDTFLHAYMDAVYIPQGLDFFTSLLNGITKYCPKNYVKNLLKLQNHKMDTPFHNFSANHKNSLKVSLLELFIDAEADINICNMLGQTVLHCAIVNMADNQKEGDEQIIKYLVECGANINAQDCYGDSPLFTCNIKSVCILIQLGADVNIQNKFGLTPLFLHAINPYKSFKFIDKLLKMGADVNIKDHHGSSVLHYVAWVKFGLRSAIVPYFLNYGCQIVQDELGHLPCHKAYENRNKAMFEALCKCEKNAHGSRENFNFEEKEVDQANLNDIDKFLYDFQCYHKSGISKLLKVPGIGSVVFEQEAEIVRLAVNDLVTRLCTEISKKDELMTVSLVHSGSVRENTKVGLPDEFDFVCVLDNISEKCELDLEATNDESGYAYLKLKPEFIGHECQGLFTKNGHLNPNDVRERFSLVMQDILKNPDFFL